MATGLMPYTAASERRLAERCLSRRPAGPPIKLCFISPLGYGLYRPDSGLAFGGAEVQFYLLARELAGDPSFHVSVLTTVKGEPSIEQQGSLTIVTRSGRGRIASNGAGSVRGYVSAFTDMFRTLAAMDADVYVHAGAGIEVGAYALICRLLRRRFIFVVASNADLSEDHRPVRGPLAWVYPMGLRLAAALICRSRDQLNMLQSRYRRMGMLVRTGHALVEGPVRSSPAPSTILWVGRMHPLKQPGMFLDLAARLPNERWVMAIQDDPAHPDLGEEVQRRARELPNVTLFRNVPLDQIGRFFEDAKMFINTSTYEGYPNTFVQAALHGAPILSWAVDPDKVLTEKGMGLCAGGSFGRLAEAVERLCADEAFRRSLGGQARAYAREHHDLNRSAEAFKTVIRHVVGQE